MIDGTRRLLLDELAKDQMDHAEAEAQAVADYNNTVLGFLANAPRTILGERIFDLYFSSHRNYSIRRRYAEKVGYLLGKPKNELELRAYGDFLPLKRWERMTGTQPPHMEIGLPVDTTELVDGLTINSRWMLDMHGGYGLDRITCRALRRSVIEGAGKIAEETVYESTGTRIIVAEGDPSTTAQVLRSGQVEQYPEETGEATATLHLTGLINMALADLDELSSTRIKIATYRIGW